MEPNIDDLSLRERNMFFDKICISTELGLKRSFGLVGRK